MSLDLSRISGNQISGLSSEELSFLETLMNDSTNDSTFNQHTGLPEDFSLPDGTLPELPQDVLDEILKLEEECKNRNTNDQTKYYVKKFKEFLTSKGLPTSIETMPIKYLSQYLRFWYATSTKKDGKLYAPATLICMRAAVNRYLNESVVDRKVNIITDKDFNASNNALMAKIAKYIKTNTNSEKSGYQAIDENDLKLLSKYFDRSTPQVLQHEVFYVIVYHFGYRGREWLRGITKHSLKLHTDPNGREFFDLVKTDAEKNVKASTNRRHFESIKTILMYSTPETPEKCPVFATKLYLSKLPDGNDTLFPKPCLSFGNESYYRKLVLGKNTLNEMMKTISIHAKLSEHYTNHCIRCTVVSELNNKGYTISEIQTVTGQKRAESVQRYIKRTTQTKKQKMSNDLSNSLHGSGDIQTEVRNIGNSTIACASGSGGNLQNQQREMPIHSESHTNVHVSTSDRQTPSIFQDCSFSNCNFYVSK